MEAARAAVVRVLADYQSAFSGHDPQGAQLYYDEPCMFVEAQRAVVLASRTEIEAFLASTMKSLEARGWSHSEWVEVNVKQLSDGVALVSTVAVRHMTDGEELERVGATYAFRKTDSGWKIAMAIPHPPDAVSRFD
jgi:ketosteroid isomerase-like protein